MSEIETPPAGPGNFLSFGANIISVAIAPDGTLYMSGHSGILRAFRDE